MTIIMMKPHFLEESDIAILNFGIILQNFLVTKFMEDGSIILIHGDMITLVSNIVIIVITRI